MTLTIEAFAGGSRPDLLLACQRLRYHVYRGLGLDTPDMDHAREVDADDRDPSSEFFAAVCPNGALAGCMRARSSEAGEGRLCLETEFVLESPWWCGRRLAEGSRFAVLDAHRNGEAPLLLLGAFRAACRRREVDHLVSIAILPDRARTRETALSALGFIAARAAVDLSLARPRRGYEAPELRMEDVASAPPVDPRCLPAMIRMLSNARSTLCSMPAYCPRFEAWSFLLRTRLGPTGSGAA